MPVVAGDGVRSLVLLLVVLDHHLDVELGETLCREADADVAAATEGALATTLESAVPRLLPIPIQLTMNAG